MGLMDMLKGAMGGKKAGAGASATSGVAGGASASGNPADMLGGMLGGLGGSNPLLKMLLPMLMGGGALGSKLGGLSGLLSKFQGAGMGGKVNSWVGTGANEPLTGDEVQQALGDDVINEMSQESGLPAHEVKGGLAGMLPGLVDKLSPSGSMPGADQLGGLVKGLDLGSLTKMFGQ